MEEPLFKACARLTLDLGAARSDVRRLIEPFARADDRDWERLNDLLGHSAYGKFWREVFSEFRIELERVHNEYATKEREVYKEGTNQN